MTRKLIYQPGDVGTETETFVVPTGGQMTVVAMGLQGDDYIEFELVDVPAIVRDPCACPPGKVELPRVGARAPLTCCRVNVKLRESKPFVVIDAPQNTRIRAILNVANLGDVWVWVTDTSTPYLTHDLRGCACT